MASGASSVRTKLAMPSLCSASATKPERAARGRPRRRRSRSRQRGSRSPSTAVWMAACGLSARSRAVRRSTLRRLGEIGLRDHQPVGEDRLLARFRRPLERVEAGDGVDHGDHHLDMEFARRARGRWRRSAGSGRDRRARWSRSGCAGTAAPCLARARPPDCAARPAGRSGCCSTGSRCRAASPRRLDPRTSASSMPTAAELVDDDGGARALRRRQEAPHQRGLAGAEEAGDDGHRNARAARALEPSPERAGIAGGKRSSMAQPSVIRAVQREAAAPLIQARSSANGATSHRGLQPHRRRAALRPGREATAMVVPPCGAAAGARKPQKSISRM